MSNAFKPLSVEDFDLSPEDLKLIVTGAQSFLAPAEDEHDAEPFNPPIDQTESTVIS